MSGSDINEHIYKKYRYVKIIVFFCEFFYFLLIIYGNNIYNTVE